MLLGTEVGLGPGDIVLDGDPAPPQKKSTGSLPTFRPMSIVVKRSPISATAELLYCQSWLKTKTLHISAVEEVPRLPASVPF